MKQDAALNLGWWCRLCLTCDKFLIVELLHLGVAHPGTVDVSDVFPSTALEAHGRCFTKK